jgi:membrane protein implicated in regulation of membrane protease activity
MSAAENACTAAFFTWLGFYFPGELGRVAWEQKSWKFFFINTGYQFLSLLVVALILIYMW